MPEIKHQFTGGKMNKDVDERLVPNGEYRDAMNIQVSTSEGSDVGTVQNVLGNTLINNQLNITNPGVCIGSVSDEKNDTVYWFVTGDSFEAAYEGDNPDIYPIEGGNYQGNLTWNPTYSDINGSNQIMLKSNFLTRTRRNSIYRVKDSVVQPVFIDEAGVIITIQSGILNQPAESQLDLAIDEGFDTSSALGLSQGFINQGLGYNFQSSLTGNGNKLEIFDGEKIKVGDKVSMWGYNPWTNESQNFLENYNEKYGGVTVVEKELVSSWVDSNGVAKEHYLITLTENLYALRWNQYLGVVQDFNSTSAQSAGYKISLSLITTHLVFQQSILGFDYKTLITGVNILDDMLFWTDNKTEPKKINITRSIEGTLPSGLVHTKLINKNTGITINNNIDVLEEHITVIKKSPNASLGIKLNTDRDPNINYSGIVRIDDGVGFDASSFTSSSSGIHYDFSSVDIGDVIKMEVISDLNSNTIFALDWEEGTKIVIKEDNGTQYLQVPVTSYTVKGVITTWPGNNFDSTSGLVKVAIDVTAIEGNPPTSGPGGFLDFVIDRFDESEKLFEFNFPRFSYRYKYQDNEYSTFAPFTEVAFTSGSLDYHPKKGYNIGMTNRVTNIDLNNYIPNDIPLDVVEVDLLYKDDSSPNIYIVDTFKPEDDVFTGNVENFWYKNSYNLTNEAIYSVVESNQLLRSWDNVPKKALAQEITGNRIVYANYLQNHDLKIGNKNFYPEFKSSIVDVSDDLNERKSIKALREYQLGVVFGDEYGRETPVLSNPTGSFTLEKEAAANVNKLKVGFKGSLTPDSLRYYKFYIKETASQYYNMAMDRYYDAEDGNIWMAFPSSDRDKIDIDTFIILKKGPDSNDLITDKARYKILAIENEAPEFIRTTRLNIGTIKHDIADGVDVFGTTFDGAPGVGRTKFTMFADPFQDSSLVDIHKIEDPIYVEFGQISTDSVSGRYRISAVSTQETYSSGSSTYEFTMEKSFGSDVNFITNDPSGLMPTQINDQTEVTFYKYLAENKPEFDGRFFVKIFADDTFENAMVSYDSGAGYRVLDEKKIYFLSQNHKAIHNFPNSQSLYGMNWPANDNSCDQFSTDTTNCKKWPYYQAYFTGEQESDGTSGNAGGGLRTNMLKTKGTDWDEVWFIDKGFSTATHGPDNLWDNGFTSLNSNNDTQGIGINNYSEESHFDLSYGPIHPQSVGVSGGTFSTGYNNIGQAVVISGAYSFYHNNQHWGLTDPAMVGFKHLTPWIQRLSSGTRFRWAEDPTGTIYTMFGATGTYNRVNYEPNTQGNVFPYADPANFRKNYRLKCVPAMTAWNPTVAGSGDAIDGTVVVNSYISVVGNPPTLSTLTAYATSNNFTVKIDKDHFWASYSNSGPHIMRWPISRGMMLTSVGGNPLANKVLVESFTEGPNAVTITFVGYENTTVNLNVTVGDALVFKQPVMNGLSENSAKNINLHNPSSSANSRNGMAAVGYTMQFIEDVVSENIIPEDPAIWETEPKENTDLDIYYEASGKNPLRLDKKSVITAIPIGSSVFCHNGGGSVDLQVLDNVSNNGNVIQLSETLCIASGTCASGVSHVEVGDIFRITRPDGTIFGVEISNVYPSGDTFSLKPNLYNSNYQLNWHNCYSYRNGVESNRIRDNFNLPFISNGVKASTRLESGYKEERREYGLIFSGIYNSTSGVNSLNQFVQALKITKDVNPSYGSIQKLHSRSTADGDLITLCEDRVLKILANKDAIFNADGNPQLTANENVLGQTIPFSGDYGISKNPESFASESYRLYFTDKIRGSVLRLSKDGLTPISNHGMKDWFRNNLKLNDVLIGSYDDKKDEYNISLKETTEKVSKTVSFKEDVRGWVSFKSFFPENAISCANEYYSMNNGRIWMHNVEQFNNHDIEVGRNNFYNLPNNSTFNVILNDVPSSVKSFNAINYEGSQSKVNQFLSDNEYYNLHPKKGWNIASISTNKEAGTISEFIEKEGKWFNYIKGQAVQLYGAKPSLSTFDQASFAIQGLGILNIDPVQISIPGCTDSNSFNYNANATIDDGSCTLVLYGCQEQTASNYYFGANVDDGSCVWFGCTINDGTMVNPTPFPPIAYSYNGGASILDDGSCVLWVYGCTDPLALNYDPLANTNATSATDATDPCVAVVNGCMILVSDNYNVNANTDDGTCTWLGCTEPLALNYGWFGSLPGSGFPAQSDNYIPSGSAFGIQNNAAACLGGGCTDSTADNYDSLATFDPYGNNGSCLYCDWTSTGTGAYAGIPIVATTLDATAANTANGQIAVEFDIAGPYQPYTYVLEDVNGNTFSPDYIGQTVGGIPDSNSVLFSSVVAGTYSVTIYGSGVASNCSYTLNNIEVVFSTVVVNFGCMEVGACNYDSLATQQLPASCDYTTCAGCTDGTAVNVNTQTNSTNPCYNSGFLPGCTISCGDGNSATTQGNYCCDYVVTGCANPLALNYMAPPAANYTVVDTVPSLCNYTGCMDTNALNYEPLAIIPDNTQCIYAPVPGCMDTTACNYNLFAAVDDGTCMYGFNGAIMGDPTLQALNAPVGSYVGQPSYYYTGNAPLTNDIVRHYVQSSGIPHNTTLASETDIGLSIHQVTDDMAEYQTTGTVTINVRMQPSVGTGAWGVIHQETIGITASDGWVYGSSGSGATWGLRNSPIGPYPFGPSSTSSSNQGFVVHKSGTLTLQNYALEVYSTVNGVDYGKHDGNTVACGVYNVFTFNPQPICSNAFANLGCTDSTACNYDATANCDDGSCYYGTNSPSYQPNSFNSIPTNTGCSACGTCNGPACDPNLQTFSSLLDCTAAYGPA